MSLTEDKGLYMARLKIESLPNERPVKVTIELPAPVHCDLMTYAKVMARESGRPVDDPIKLIVPMLSRFMATDRAFVRARRLQLQERDENG